MNARPLLCQRRPLTTIAILVGSIVSVGAQQATLQYRWTKGEDVAYRFAQESTASISGLPGGLGDIDVQTRMSQRLRARVEDVAADGAATINYLYESARWEVISPMGTMRYDTAASDNPPADAMSAPIREMLTALVGESFVVVMSRQGEIQKVEGMDRLMEKVFKGLPSNPELQAALQGLRSSFSDAGMRAAFAQAYSLFPDRAVKPGDTWERQMTMPVPMVGQMTARTAFTLKALEGSGAEQVAKITMNLTMTSDPGSAPVAPMGMKLELGESSGEGELTFAVAEGRLLLSSMRFTMPVSMSGTGPDGAAMKMKTVVDSTMVVELVRP